MVTLKELIDKIAERMGYVPTKSYEQLWSMAQEAKLFTGSLTKEYEQQPTVYKAIKAIGDNVSQAELKFYNRKTGDEVVGNPDLERLFKYRPNPLMSFNELLEATVIFHRLYGEAFWTFTPSIGQQAGTSRIPAEIWTFNPQKFQPINANDMMAGWRLGNQTLQINEVLHFKDFNPYDSIRGLSPLKPARQTIEIDWQSMLYNKAFFKNDATPSFLLSTDKQLSPKQRDQLKDWWNAHYKGASKSFKMAILESGLKAQTLGHSSKDMEFIEQKRFNREELIGMWRVPKSMFSITDDLNYATFMGQKKVFWTDTIMPILKRLAEEINAQFLEQFMPEVYCRWDYSNVVALKEEFGAKLDQAQKLFAMGVPFNVINEQLELGLPEDIEGADVGYLPFNLVPVGSSMDLGGKQEEPKKSAKPMSIDFVNEKIWKQFIRRHDPQEKKMEKKVRRYLYEQRGRILQRMNEKSFIKQAVFDFDWVEEDKILMRMMTPVMLESVLAGAEMAQSIAGGQVDQSVLESKLRSYASVRVNKITGVNETIRKKLEKELEEGIKAGESVNALSDRIRAFYNGWSPMSALRIARTETTGALNGGSFQYYEAIGAKTKTWITAGGEVRDSHLAQQGMTIGIQERFPNGLLFPSDEGAPEEVINCRCTLITRETFGWE